MAQLMSKVLLLSGLCRIFFPFLQDLLFYVVTLCYYCDLVFMSLAASKSD